MALTKSSSRMTSGAPTNVLDYSGLAVGNDWAPAINAALAKGGTAVMPAGNFPIASSLTVPSGTNFLMDGETTITAAAAMYAMIQTSGEHRNGLISGGQLRCNPTGASGNNLAEVGVWLKHASMIRIKDIEIWDNNQYGVLIGDLGSSTNFIYEVFMENMQIRRSLIAMPATSHGVYWSEGGDCHMSDCIIMGQNYGVGGMIWNTHFDRVHVWTPQENGIGEVGFYIAGGGCTLVQCQVDGPTKKGIHLVGDDNTVSHFKYLMPNDYNGTDNQAYGVWIEPGKRACVVNSLFSGGNTSFRIVAGIGGANRTQTTETGNITMYAVTPPIERSRSGARAYVRFLGASPSVFSGMNIASVGDNGVGDFTINLGEFLPTTNYVVTATTDVTNQAVVIREISRTATSVRIEVLNLAGTKVDGLVQLVIHDLH